MTFLFPLFLAGAAAVAIPVLLHLRRRPPQDVVPFSAMMFLETAPVPPVKRRKLEDLLLLALRCLALVLLALMFARPLWGAKESAAARARSHVILIDRSASMRRDDIRPQITQQIEAALKDVGEEDDAALVSFDREPRLVAGFEACRAQAPGQRKSWLRQQAVAIEPGWSSTDLGGALVFAAGLMDSGGGEDAPARERRITVISDFQESASLDALGSFAWPQDIPVVSLRVQPGTLDNLTVSPAARNIDEDTAQTPATGTAGPASLPDRVRIANSRGSKLTKFSISWKGDPRREVVTGEVAAGASRVVDAPPRDAATADAEIELNGDSIAFDNRAWFARVTPRALRVLFVSDAPAAADAKSPLFFISRALLPGAGLAPQLVAKSVKEAAAADLAAADFVIIASPPSDAFGDALRGWISQNHVLLWLASAEDNGAALSKVAGLDGLAFTEARGGAYAMLGEIHYEHPVMKPFSEPGVRDFSKIRFWKHRVTSLAGKSRIREIASFDDGSPAIFEASVGLGRVITITSGWTAQESQLGVSSKFVPLIYSILGYAGFGSARNETLTVGDPIPVDGAQKVDSLKITLPGGASRIWNAKENPLFTETDTPGIYTLGEGADARSHAVNIAAAEGRIAPMEMGRLREFGLPLAESAGAVAGITAAQAEDRTALDDARREQKQKLWKAFAAAAALVLLLETLVAARFRSRGAPQPAVS